VDVGLNDSRKKADTDDIIVHAQGFEKGLDVEPLSLGPVYKNAIVPVERIDVDGAALLWGYRRDCEWFGHKK
jgi:hypothetical protein